MKKYNMNKPMMLWVIVKVNFDDEELEWIEVCKSFREVKKVFRNEGIFEVSEDDEVIQPNEDEKIVYYIEKVGVKISEKKV